MHPSHGGFILTIQGWFNNIKSINAIHYTNNRRKRGKTTTHEKVFYPKMFRKSLKKLNNHIYMLKRKHYSKPAIQGNVLNMIKHI